MVAGRLNIWEIFVGLQAVGEDPDRLSAGVREDTNGGDGFHERQISNLENRHLFLPVSLNFDSSKLHISANRCHI